MERIRRIFESETAREASYEPLDGGSERPDGERIDDDEAAEFSWADYGVFLLLGVAMLWAWNMFLAAAPYFQRRFAHSDTLLHNFQSAIMSVSTVGNLGSMLVLTQLQARANYPKRISIALVMNVAVFTLLALSTKLFTAVAPAVYFAFLMLMVAAASLATGLLQNGVFAFVAGYGRGEYTQGIMVGQGVAGVLPCVAQIVSVLSVPSTQHDEEAPKQSSTSALIYFLTATLMSAIAFGAFFYLLSKSHTRLHTGQPSSLDTTPEPRKPIPLPHLARKLSPLAIPLFLTFTLTMLFPVYTARIHSTRPSTSPLATPPTFIPLAFLVWNTGDLLGRMGPALPRLRISSPRTIMLLALARAAVLPLYSLCNVDGAGARVGGDAFYLAVQVIFGVSNGFLGSACMMGFTGLVGGEEREAAGGFMSLCLVGGLAAGSLLSFGV